MIFSNAIYLWGLLGLLLPIAIHLWSRKKVKTIKVGSTKLLVTSEPKQTSSIKLNELWLLFLRLLALVLLVLILAEPSISRTEKNVAINYLVEPSLLNDERMSSILDTIPKESIRILENGFPKWDDYDFEKAPKPPSYWQLAQKMHSISSDSLVVFSKGFLNGFKGARPIIGANTRWIVFESNEPRQKVLGVIQKESHAEVLSVSSDATVLSFKKDTISLDSDLVEINTERDSVRLSSSISTDWMLLHKNNPIHIGILENDTLTEQIQYFQAAYRGISRFLNIPVEIKTLKNLNAINAYDFDTLISYDTSLSEELETNLLIFQPNTFADQLIIEGTTKNVFHLTQLLDSENIVNKNLPIQLLKLLGLHAHLNNDINSMDYRVLAESELQPPKSIVEPLKNVASIFEITPWFWLFFILVIVAERILSKLRKQ